MNAQEIASLPHGAPLEGGFYAGLIRVLDDVFAIVVAPKAEGESKGQWGKKYGAEVSGAGSFFHGQPNTLAMAESGSALAQWALGLQINGHADWYLPSRDELELVYRNLKPSTQTNSCSFRDGDNASSSPPGYEYTETAPGQTDAAAFREGGEQALEKTWHWSSTQYSAHGAWLQDFSVGTQDSVGKSYEGRARAVRRFKVSP